MVNAIPQWPAPAVGSPRQLTIEGWSRWKARPHRRAYSTLSRRSLTTRSNGTRGYGSADLGVSLILTLLISLGLSASIWMVRSAA